VEIWNLVFNSYFKNEKGEYVEMEKKCVDTGSGLERLCCAINGYTSVYDLDVFSSLMDFLKRESDICDEKMFKIIIDHFKAV